MSAPTATERTRPNLLRFVAIAVGAFAFAAIVHSLLYVTPVVWNDHCGDDGAEYCRMAQGRIANRPWSRRILLPGIVGQLADKPEEIPQKFQVVNLLSIFVIAGGTGVLTARMARRAGSSKMRARDGGLVAGFLILLMPMGFHWTRFYPVLVDAFSGAIGILWFLLSSARRNLIGWLSLPLAFLAVISRETWLPIIAIVLLTQLAVERSRARLVLAGGTAGAIGLGGWIAFSAPGFPNSVTDPFIANASQLLRHYFLSGGGAEHLLWMTLFSWGLIPLLLLRRPGDWLRRALDERGQRASVLLPAAVALAGIAAIAVVGGNDLHRFLFTGAPFLVSLSVSHVARQPRLDIDLALVVAASLVVWQPFHALDGSREAYFRFFSPIYLSESATHIRLINDLTKVAVPMLVWMALILWRRLSHARTSTARG